MQIALIASDPSPDFILLAIALFMPLVSPATLLPELALIRIHHNIEISQYKDQHIKIIATVITV